MIVRSSAHPHVVTVQRLTAAIERRGITVFARIDHAGGARDVGLELPEELVIVFGNPRAGTPLMRHDPRVGIELPLRILVWERDGAVHVGYNDPRELAAAYDLQNDGATLEHMAGLCEQLAAEAAGVRVSGAPLSA